MQKYLKISLVAALFMAFTLYIISGVIESSISISSSTLNILLGNILFVFLAVLNELISEKSEQLQSETDRNFLIISIIFLLLGVNTLLVPLIDNEMKSKVASSLFAISFLISMSSRAYSKLKSFIANIRKTSYKKS